MTSLKLLPMEPGVISVEIEEGDGHTALRLAVPDEFLDQLGLPDLEPVEVAREAVGFLLDRQPAAAIPREVSLYDIARDHDGFTDELLAGLDTTTPNA